MAHFYLSPLATSNSLGPNAVVAQQVCTLHRIFTTLLRQQQLLSYVSTQTEDFHQELDNFQQALDAFASPSVPRSVPTKDQLRKHLESATATFDLSLELVGVVPNPVCKGKYFSFEVSLHSSGQPLPSSEQFKAGLAIYSAESVPQRLMVNMLGQPLLKGLVQPRLVFDEALQRHKARFKVQISEVTSHFRNGWVFLVVTADEDHEFLAQTGYRVRPLIVEHLVSKAKESICNRWRAKSKVRDIQPDPVP